MALTWDQILNDNGLPPPPVLPVDTGIYPFGINGFSWELGGDEYLGDPSRIPPSTWTGGTGWYIVYQEAVALHGAAKSTVPCNVTINNFNCWLHPKTGGWVHSQSASDGIANARLTPNQVSGAATAVTNNGDGSFTWAAPGAGFINHGWPGNRCSFAANSVDGLYWQFDMKVDQNGANYIAASGADWWTTPFAAGNTGYSQSIWKRLTTSYTTFTGTSLSQAILIADPPPPLVGIVPGTPPPPPPPPPPPIPAPVVLTFNGVQAQSGDVFAFSVF